MYWCQSLRVSVNKYLIKLAIGQLFFPHDFRRLLDKRDYLGDQSFRDFGTKYHESLWYEFIFCRNMLANTLYVEIVEFC